MEHTRVSTSLLQRRLRIGYPRAARLIDMLEEEGVVGAAESGQSRQVLVSADRDPGFGDEDDDESVSSTLTDPTTRTPRASSKRSAATPRARSAINFALSARTVLTTFLAVLS